ncbi:M23 family metallopeptidase [Aliikangiella coralliicola]|uniref:M23 family metallopeptidase n=1 Tax=Aliikangiella coralliicola TaxID=2592383 RepID=A0A545UK48_9GAMM|nr:M23 family metallopeptidase [Aliikangiella coralliicola]TQV89840.1 M23 family metallopeptidase [Aliikangiella coralliicola]
MSITILQRSPQGMRSVKLKNRYVYSLLSLFILFPTATAVGGYYFASQRAEMAEVEQVTIDNWKRELSNQWRELDMAKRSSQQQLNALTAKLGMMQAHIRRLDAAGERIVSIAGLDAKEFNFDDAPAIGGPEKATASDTADIPQLLDALNEIDNQLDSRQQQLSVLESLLMDKHMGVERYISGRPIKKGWMSSYYGERNDPFTGKPAWHGGIDFAGKEGASIHATAAGVVSWVGDRYGYGLLIEINHGDGLVTRYGHNKKALVKKGDVVSKGQAISKMGNTGRSTGAHVHYEVLKNGRNVNPLPYVNRRAKG